MTAIMALPTLTHPKVQQQVQQERTRLFQHRKIWRATKVAVLFLWESLPWRRQQRGRGRLTYQNRQVTMIRIILMLWTEAERKKSRVWTPRGMRLPHLQEASQQWRQRWEFRGRNGWNKPSLNLPRLTKKRERGELESLRWKRSRGRKRRLFLPETSLQWQQRLGARSKNHHLRAELPLPLFLLLRMVCPLNQKEGERVKVSGIIGLGESVRLTDRMMVIMALGGKAHMSLWTAPALNLLEHNSRGGSKARAFKITGPEEKEEKWNQSSLLQPLTRTRRPTSIICLHLAQINMAATKETTRMETNRLMKAQCNDISIKEMLIRRIILKTRTRSTMLTVREVLSMMKTEQSRMTTRWKIETQISWTEKWAMTRIKIDRTCIKQTRVKQLSQKKWGVAKNRWTLTGTPRLLFRTKMV
mmetsp:Transcript_3336/g.8638  ORF Transcript_3336/g.8638 Transcript_3336/m.8638 type:complete len:415 (+) Transcript_3336:341-1585(+)